MSHSGCKNLKKDRGGSLQPHFFCLEIRIRFNMEEMMMQNIFHFFCQCKQYIGLVKKTA